MTDTIHTVTLTPQEMAAYASGWNRAIEAAAKAYETCGGAVNDWDWFEAADHAIRALSMPAPAPAQAWRDISTAPYGAEVIVRAGRMTFPAVLRCYASLDSDRNDWEQWQASEEGQHPPCWSGGACWEDDMPSLQPEAWMPVSAELIPDTEGV